MLSRAVSIYVLSRRRPDLPRLENVSQTHLQELLNLPAGLQDQLLRRVVEEKWSVRRLRKEVADSMPGVVARARRPRTPRLSKQLRMLTRIVDGCVLTLHPSGVSKLQMDEAQELLHLARLLLAQAEGAARVLTEHLESLVASGAWPMQHVLPPKH
jgi:hypothetical protein